MRAVVECRTERVQEWVVFSKTEQMYQRQRGELEFPQSLAALLSTALAFVYEEMNDLENDCC